MTGAYATARVGTEDLQAGLCLRAQIWCVLHASHLVCDEDIRRGFRHPMRLYRWAILALCVPRTFCLGLP